MALLDMQAMDPARDETATRWEDGSDFSLALCLIED